MLRLSDCGGPQVLFARMTIDGPFPSALCVIEAKSFHEKAGRCNTPLIC